MQTRQSEATHAEALKPILFHLLFYRAETITNTTVKKQLEKNMKYMYMMKRR